MEKQNEEERETDGNYLDRVGSSKSDTSKGYKLPHLVEVNHSEIY